MTVTVSVGRGCVALALLALAGCKDRSAKPAPAPPTTAVVVDAGPPRIPKPTDPDPDWERRRDELLRRGDPARMPIAAPDAGAAAMNPADMIKVVDRDHLKVGALTIDLAAGVIELPVTVSVTNAPLEYVLVAPGGKAYESLFIGEVSAIELRLALTLLGFDGPVPDGANDVPKASAADGLIATYRVGKRERPVADLFTLQASGKPPAPLPYQAIGFGPADRDAALATRELITLVARDRVAPLRIAVDAGNPYAGQGVVTNTAAMPASGAALTLVLRRMPNGPAPQRPSPAGLHTPEP